MGTAPSLSALCRHQKEGCGVHFSPDSKVKQGLFISNDWLVEGRTSTLWLPPDYRVTCEAVWNKVIVLGHSSGGISILGFNEGSRLIEVL
jgi:hypothetical protein